MTIVKYIKKRKRKARIANQIVDFNGNQMTAANINQPRHRSLNILENEIIDSNKLTDKNENKDLMQKASLKASSIKEK
jgi:hypothetical protein